MLVAKGYYFVFFAAIGCLVPFFNIYLQQKGLTGVEIGWLNSIAPLVALAANPFWGGVADRWQIHWQVLALCATVAGIVTLLFLPVSGFWLLLILVTALAFFRTPIGAIVDSTVMDLVKQTESSYGQQRLWGTIGFVLATFSLGQLLAQANLSLIFWLHGGLLGLGCAALSLLLPVQGTGQKTDLLAGLRVLTGQPGYLSFLIAMTLMGMGIATYVGFLGLHLLALGGAEQQVGLAWAVSALPELLPMYYGRWFDRYSHQRLVMVGLLGFALVWVLVGLAQTPGMIIALVPGSGLCFGFFWVAAVGYASETAPPGLSATAQTLMGAAQSGLGWALGSVVAGYLWDLTNGHVVLFFAAAIMALGALIFWAGNRGRG
ncbi:MAG TPA: MFS transporter [Anaerolineae bacterium]